MSITSVNNSSVSDLILDLKRQGSVQLTLQDRIAICRTCVEGVCGEAAYWAEEAAVAKGLAADSPIRAEDMLNGPVVIARQLQLTVQTLLALSRDVQPKLPGKVSQLRNGQTVVPVFPTSGYFDSLTFMGLAGHVRMQPGVTPQDIHGSGLERVRKGNVDGIVVVLGAGNVSSIPATDSLTKIMFEGRRVILKMNPVNEYLTPIFERAFRGLINANLLRIATGGPDVGAQLVNHPDVDEVHITGSGETHDAIVWGSDATERTRRKQAGTPVLSKTITSELGNVTPWIIVPGTYSAGQLRSQAKHVAASITNNASFNCLATKAIITWNQWAQRDEFLDLVNHCLEKTPRRPAYYPGATLDDVQSGIGSVHNTYLLDRFEKTVLEGPLVNFPRPIWFPDHKNALTVAEGLLGLCQRPSVTKLPRLFAAALMG